MVGIVVVSHSPDLASAAVRLAHEMLAGRELSVAVAAGAAGGATGTDAVAVAEAIGEVATPDGVLVLMDLGSAVLSAEMALELVDLPNGCEVRLCSAPFVEGLVAAGVQASLGASLELVHGEAVASLRPKQEQLREQPGDPGPRPAPVTHAVDDVATAEVTLVNAHGLHARPAATFVRTASQFDAQVQVSNLTMQRGPADAASLIAVAALGADQGHRVRLDVTGPQANAALAELVRLVEEGFGDTGET